MGNIWAHTKNKKKEMEIILLWGVLILFARLGFFWLFVGGAVGVGWLAVALLLCVALWLVAPLVAVVRWLVAVAPLLCCPVALYTLPFKLC